MVPCRPKAIRDNKPACKSQRRLERCCRMPDDKSLAGTFIVFLLIVARISQMNPSLLATGILKLANDCNLPPFRSGTSCCTQSCSIAERPDTSRVSCSLRCAVVPSALVIRNGWLLRPPPRAAGGHCYAAVPPHFGVGSTTRAITSKPLKNVVGVRHCSVINQRASVHPDG